MKLVIMQFQKYVSQLLNVHRVSDVRHIEIHTAEPLVPDPFEVEITIAKLKMYKSASNDQKLIQIKIYLFH
jgi:hypothetical protein